MAMMARAIAASRLPAGALLMKLRSILSRSTG